MSETLTKRQLLELFVRGDNLEQRKWAGLINTMFSFKDSVSYAFEATENFSVDASTIAHTGSTIFNTTLAVNSASVALFNGVIDIGTALSTGELVKGSYYDIDGLTGNHTDSKILAYDALLTFPTGDVTDGYGYRVLFDGSRNQTAFDYGVYVGGTATANGASYSLYGVAVDFSAITDTDYLADGFRGVSVVMPSTYQGTDAAHAGYFSGAGATVGIISGGANIYCLDLGASAAIRPIDIAHTASTTSSIYAFVGVNSTTVSIVNIQGYPSAALTGTEAITGVESNLDTNGSDADGTAYHAFRGVMTATTAGRSDNAVYSGFIKGSRTTADTDQGLFISFGDAVTAYTQNSASSTSYGVRIAAQTGATQMVHTAGTWYGIHINHTTVVTAGTATALAINIASLDNSATVTQRAIDITTSAIGATAVNQTSFSLTQTMAAASAGAANQVEAMKIVLSSAYQMGNWANAIVGKIDLTTTGYVSGLGGVICAELDLPSTNPAGGAGTYTCFEAELGIPNAYTSGVPVSFMNMNVWGIGGAGGVDTFDDNGFIFDITGLTSGAAHIYYDHDGTAGGDTVNGWLRIRIGGVTQYIGLYDAVH